jgi:acyl carrier protein
MDLKNVINNVLEGNGIDTIDTLDSSMNLKDDLGMDSFMLAELTVEIEDEIGIDIFADGIVSTVGDIIEKING